jgi:hypothetical protein
MRHYRPESEFKPTEQFLLDHFEQQLIDRRETSQALLEQGLENIEKLGPVSQFALVTVLADRYQRSLEDPGSSIRIITNQGRASLLFKEYAEGLYFAYGPSQEALLQTGEFRSISHMLQAVKLLGLSTEQAHHKDAMSYLVHWMAARYPSSEAEGIVRYYGLPSGKLAQNFPHGPCFNFETVMVHESVLEDHLDLVSQGLNTNRSIIDPIIALTLSPDNIEQAAELASPRTARYLLQN